jgi:hypothetical protein
MTLYFKKMWLRFISFISEMQKKLDKYQGCFRAFECFISMTFCDISIKIPASASSILTLKDVREVTGISLDFNISGSMIVVFLKRGEFEATRMQ